MQPRRHQVFRIALGLIIASTICLVLTGASLTAYAIYYEATDTTNYIDLSDSIGDGILFIFFSGVIGTSLYFIVRAWYQRWQAHDLDVRRKEQRRRKIQRLKK